MSSCGLIIHKNYNQQGNLIKQKTARYNSQTVIADTNWCKLFIIHILIVMAVQEAIGESKYCTGSR